AVFVDRAAADCRQTPSVAPIAALSVSLTDAGNFYTTLIQLSASPLIVRSDPTIHRTGGRARGDGGWTPSPSPGKGPGACSVEDKNEAQQSTRIRMQLGASGSRDRAAARDRPGGAAGRRRSEPRGRRAATLRDHHGPR